MNRVFVLLLGVFFATTCIGAALPISGYAYITNQLDSSISVIEIPGGKVTAKLETAPNPAPIAICGATAIATSADAHQITLINLITLETEQMDLGSGPFGIDCDQDTAYISDWFTHQVYPFDITKAQALPPLSVGHAPAGVLLNIAQQHLYVANRDDDTISVIDLQTRQDIATLPTGDAPYGLVLNPGLHHLYVINVRSSDVTVIDTRKLEVITQWPVGEWPYCGIVNQQGDLLYVTNQEDATLSVVDTQSGKTLQTIEISEVPEGIDITADQRYIVTVGWESGVIDIIDAQTLTLVRRQKSGKGARAFGRFITTIEPHPEMQ